MVAGTFSSYKIFLTTYVILRKPKVHKKHHLVCGDSCLHSKNPGRIFTDNSPAFVKAFQDLQWTHDTQTPHCSETNVIAERAVRRVREGTTTATVQSGLPDQWWDCAVECYCHMRNVHDKTADDKTWCEKRFGVTFDGLLMPFEANISDKPASSKDDAASIWPESRTRRKAFVSMCRRNFQTLRSSSTPTQRHACRENFRAR